MDLTSEPSAVTSENQRNIFTPISAVDHALLGEIRVFRPMDRPHRTEHLLLRSLSHQLRIRLEHKRRPSLLGWG